MNNFIQTVALHGHNAIPVGLETSSGGLCDMYKMFFTAALVYAKPFVRNTKDGRKEISQRTSFEYNCWGKAGRLSGSPSNYFEKKEKKEQRDKNKK